MNQKAQKLEGENLGQTQGPVPLDHLLRVIQQGAGKREWIELQSYVEPFIYRQASRLANGNKDDAWDITQEAWRRIIRGIPNFRFDSAFLTWCYRVLVNAATDWYRTEKNQRLVSLDNISNQATGSPHLMFLPSALKDAQVSELYDIVLNALEKLPGRHREIILMRQDYSSKEIAATLGYRTEHVVNAIYHRAIRKLRAELRLSGVVARWSESED